MKEILKSISFFAMVLMACVNLSSCSSDGDDPDEPDTAKYEVLGKWRVEKLDFLQPTTPIEDVTYGSGFQHIKLTADGIIEFYDWDYEKVELKSEKQKGTFTVKGNQLTISCSNKYMNGIYTIEKATKTQLILVKKTAEYTIQIQWGPSYYDM